MSLNESTLTKCEVDLFVYTARSIFRLTVSVLDTSIDLQLKNQVLQLFFYKDIYMNSTSSLNSTGQAFLAVIGSFAVNAAVHPLCTIKNRLMANEKPFSSFGGRVAGFKALYHGYTEICLTESGAYAMSYVVNGFLKRKEIDPFVSSILAGVASTPIVTVGEALMVNRQVHGGSLSLHMLRGAMRGSSLFATILREIPFSVAIFSFAPAIERSMPFSNELANNTISGLISGSICGALTAPADKIKTLVQARELSFTSATAEVFSEIRTVRGKRKILAEAFTRAVYIGLAVAILNVLNNQLPPFLPSQMKR